MAVNTTIQVTLPAMGESVTEGTVLEWHKQEGDTVEADETIVEISTDKVDAEVPAPAAGTVTKIHFAEGDTVTVGAVLAEISSSGNGASPAAAAEPAEAEAEAEAPADDTPGGVVDIVTPAGGESVTEGTILEWAVRVGEPIAEGDTVVEISTDKVDMELPAPVTGTLTEIVADEGETVTVGQVIGRIQAGAGAAKKPAADANGSGNGAAAAPPKPVETDQKITPVAARAAAAEGVDVAGLKGTGPG